MKVLVTGATGFVGREMCAALAHRGHAVRRALRRSSVPSPPLEDIVVGEINESTQWDRALDGIDGVIHLAARVHVMKETVADPLSEFRKVNVGGTERLASSAATAGVRRFVFMSSIKVNGERTGAVPFRATDTPQPVDAYAISKWEAEQWLRQLEQRAVLAPRIVRAPLVYGPGVKGNFETLLRTVDRGLPLPLGTVRNRRSMVFVRNLVDLVVAALEVQPAPSQVLLASDGAPISTPELIREVGHALERRTRLLPIPVFILRALATIAGRRAAFDRLCGSLEVDSSSTFKALGFSPRYTLQEGLRETASWYRTVERGQRSIVGLQ